MNQASFFKDKELREKFLDKIELLEEFGELETFYDTNCSTLEMVARYYKCPLYSVRKELEGGKSSDYDDEDKMYIGEDYFTSKGFRVIKKGVTFDVYDKKDNLLFKNLSCNDNSKMRLLTKRGILKVGMFLKDSMVAINIRKKMLTML